ncbi:hypothetical protein Goari_025714, partial [Gossypium aridum]|nr:hypothetical protein [Gossypium aridum]
MGEEAKAVVPESLLKKNKRNEEWELAKKQELEVAKKKKVENRKLIYSRAKQYAKEYGAQEKELIQLKREARLKGGFYVDPEAKLLFIIRIRGINAMHPRTRKILQLLRLRQVTCLIFPKLKFCVMRINSSIFPECVLCMNFAQIEGKCGFVETLGIMIFNGVFLKVNKATMNMLHL